MAALLTLTVIFAPGTPAIARRSFSAASWVVVTLWSKGLSFIFSEAFSPLVMPRKAISPDPTVVKMFSTAPISLLTRLSRLEANFTVSPTFVPEAISTATVISP